MNTRNLLIAAVLVFGVVSGPSSLESAALSEPQLSWSDLAFVFAGCALALFLVLGFQGVLGNAKALRRGWSLFALGSVYALSAGLSALAVSLSRAGRAPYSFLFLAVGAGMLVGTALVRRVFRRRFENVA